MKPEPKTDGSRLQARNERKRLRKKLLDRIEDIPGPFWARLAKCGKPLTLLCNGCLSTRNVETGCRWKCCPVCQPALVATSAKRFARIANGCTWPSLITFNAKHTTGDDVLAFRQMRDALVRFRAQRWWKLRVKGGVSAWEVSRLGSRERKARRLGKDNGWHFHCHVLADCKWLWCSTPPPRPGASKDERNARIKIISDELNGLWSMAMGGRKGSLHVRRVWKANNGGIDGAVHEVLKYACSGAALAETEWDIEPVLWALEKTRMVAGFGSFYRHPLIKRIKPAPAMCECGCSEWCPEQFHESTHALRNARRH